MKVLKFKKIKNKYRVFLDNSDYIDLYENVIIKYDILIKNKIEEKDIDNINKDNRIEELYQKSLSYIGIKMRTKNEIIKYLKKNNASQDEVDDIVNRLEKNNVLNDELYIKSYINDRFNLSTDGPLKIRLFLINEGFNEEIINKYLFELDNDDIKNKLNKLVDKKIKATKNYSGSVLKFKMVSYFTNLGYDREMIEEILSSKNEDDTDQGIKEYKKLYEKYKNKYTPEKLDYVIRQKLYIKGYDYDKIKRNI